MELFSQREGFKPIKTILQIDSMDDDLRNSLWNALVLYYLDPISQDNYFSDYRYKFIISLWTDFFKHPVDSIPVYPTYWFKTFKIIKDVYNKLKWHEIYDFIEFFACYFPNEKINIKFIKDCNHYLERELSAYRFVGNKISKLTSEEEIKEIEKALNIKKPFDPVPVHLERALDLLSDRESPDYRNSIKESISAVEAACQIITSNKKASLGDALEELKKNYSLHPALKKAFSSLYGYTSETEGIRHALLEESTLIFEDAKYMLVACSAFTNYLISKIHKKK